MTNMIKVGATINSKELMTSLEVAELTGREHKNVMRDIRNMLESLDEKGRLNFELTSYNDSQSKSQPMYAMNKKGAICLASGYDVNLRMKIIDRWEELEMEKFSNKIVIPDFTNPADAAIAWAEQYRAAEQAKLESKQHEEHIKLLVHDKKTYTTSEIAKEVGMKSANQLNKFLESQKIQYMLNGTWLLYSNYADKDLVSIKQMTCDSGKIIYDRRWNGKGRDFILNLFKKD